MDLVGTFLASCSTWEKITSKYPHLRDTIHTTHLYIEWLSGDQPNLNRDSRDKNIRDTFKADSREYDFLLEKS